jgi:PKHD-type hydroxylase
MLLQIEDVLSADDLAAIHDRLETARWHGGDAAVDDPVARELGDTLIERLLVYPAFFAATLPLRTCPPRFHRASPGVPGMPGGMGVDAAIRHDTRHSPPLAVRSDVVAEVFLSDPATYEGGELIVDDAYGTHAVKAPAGHMVVFASDSPYRIEPVTRGVRASCRFQVQSMVPSAAHRRLLFDMDVSIQALTAAGGDRDALVRLTGVYHNLLREWSKT